MQGKLGRLISCKEASRAISQMQDGSVSLPMHLRIRLHLIWCEACRRFLEQVRFLREAMRRYRE
jgi:predicted anti-sigma-YlaC factor YlaD